MRVEFPQNILDIQNVRRRHREGWLFTGDGDIMRIDPHWVKDVYDTKIFFNTDEQAIEFVKKQAAKGSQFHIDAITFWAMIKLTT